MLFGDGGGLTKSALRQATERDSLSDFLPWVAFSRKTGRFLLGDNTIAHIWECRPLAFATPAEAETLEGLFRVGLPEGAVVQWCLYADPNIEGFIQWFRGSEVRSEPLLRKMGDRFEALLRDGASTGFSQLNGVPARNFRIWVVVKSLEELSKDAVAGIEEILKGTGLAPVRMQVESLVGSIREMLSGEREGPAIAYDETVPIRRQLINAETRIRERADELRLGKRYARVLTPRVVPTPADLLETNMLSGGILGMKQDGEQLTTPFLWSVSCVIGDKIKEEIKTRAGWTLKQSFAGSLAIQLGNRIREFGAVLRTIDRDQYVRYIPSLVVFADTPEETRMAVARARRIWENCGYRMQEERRLRKVMVIASLPGGLYATADNLQTMDRDFIARPEAIVRLLPFQADFSGNARPVIAVIGRKGQVAGIDVFDAGTNNHNYMIAAGSGAGKSVFIGNMLARYYAAGALARLIDLGGSYEKLCALVKGRYLDFGKERIVINPFSSEGQDAEDREHDLAMAQTVLAEMVYSASGQTPREVEWTLLKYAVEFAVARDGGEYGIDHVEEFLGTYPAHAPAEVRRFKGDTDTAREMAFNLRDFVSRGAYGRFFNGQSSFRIKDDRFVVLELEALKAKRELFNVATLQVLNAVTQDLYLSDRTTRRFITFEEAWSFFREDDLRLAYMIEEGYRRARKYNGSFGAVTQSPLDMQKFGKTGDVIKGNSAFKFWMESPDYEAAATAQVIDYKGLALELLKGIKTNKPRYSETFFETPRAKGAGRLVLDPYNYGVATSAGDERAEIMALLREGRSQDEAIEIFAARLTERRRHTV